MCVNVSTPEFRDIQYNLATKLSVFSYTRSQNQVLFTKIKTVYNGSLITPHEADKQRVKALTCNSFSMKGAEVD